MKKVRFLACETVDMNDSECHSPRPFLEKRVNIEDIGLCYDYPKPVAFSLDPVHRFETSNCSPYPLVDRTNLDDSISTGPSWSPSSELELSMLDAGYHEPRKPPLNLKLFEPHLPFNSNNDDDKDNVPPQQHNKHTPSTHSIVLGSIENASKENLPNKMNGDNSFFITKGKLNKLQMQSFTNLHRQFNRLTLEKENNPASKKLDILKIGQQDSTSSTMESKRPVIFNSSSKSNLTHCSCHHCTRNVGVCDVPIDKGHLENNVPASNLLCQCMRVLPPSCNCGQCACRTSQQTHPPCHTSNTYCEPKPQNTVDKKSWAIEKYEQIQNTDCNEVQKPTSVKEKREPTVADLFKIIKLQNEQLQLLQEKVDKVISSGNNRPTNLPIQSYTTEHVSVETMNSEQHKISIGVMTSFEMVRTSTVINKEVVQQKENSQIQCNRSQLSIKEVVSKSPINMNFLDGIAPVGKNIQGNGNSKIMTGNNEEKTFNEFSLYNVQVDNATTPLMSPEQTLYLDVRDYSDSDNGSDDQSNVGWTYYNKVMTHVNGMLQDSDMPSSASALYRNTRQHCLQMQIDKTNGKIW
ncbi:uncharacterized protein LOC128669921 isoform X2 [Plodia interpunctella]|uniref:uncharacterized protein LOC128669921 isoform X2 n=1 Tax=Plodia interpunctella TaxID=58824 RepID=UPI0023681FD8|nr:uncharacterized protein LOC128669921 isoform X2 [Plodia interpunctella]